MYRPALFRLDDRDRALSICERFPFATVVTHGEHGFEATPVPLLVDRDRGELVGHVARANPIAKRLDGADALCVFSGPHAYVSPRWYPDPANVPTWNYVAVHVTGKARTFDDAAELRAVLAALVTRFEAGEGAPWTLEAAGDLVGELLPAIVGFRVPCAKIEAKLKLSQNRAPADARGALEGLEASADVEGREVAAWMRAIGVGQSG
jgi:transcriptional regulator